jgi:hypothetical protein
MRAFAALYAKVSALNNGTTENTTRVKVDCHAFNACSI